jgi:hypothetical protein
MKAAAVLSLVLLFPAGAQMPAIHSVYLFPMGNGMDQYLASRITAEGVFQVVTDPKRAEAVFTDRLGEAFEQRMAGLFPEAPPPAPKPQAKEEKATEKDQEEEVPAAVTEEGGPPRVSSFARGKGNFFLVDTKSRAVLWSVYERPRNNTPDELNRTAKRIVERLTKALAKK